MEQAWEHELRLLIADARREPHRDAPTLGRLFGDTPGAPSRDDDSRDVDRDPGTGSDAGGHGTPPLQVMTLEEWERSWS